MFPRAVIKKIISATLMDPLSRYPASWITVQMVISRSVWVMFRSNIRKMSSAVNGPLKSPSFASLPKRPCPLALYIPSLQRVALRIRIYLL